MSLIQTLLAFFVVLGTLVVVHELGHFLVARWCGVKVLRFSVGMGKVIWSRRFGADQTEWALSMLPLGGYVQMLDARDQDLAKLSPADLAREFTRQPVGKRIAIVAAGPIANFLLAILIYTGLFYSGMPEPVANFSAPAVLGQIAADGPARRAGLQEGDLILEIDAQPVRDAQDFIERIRAAPGKTLALHGQRGAQAFDVEVTPDAVDSDGQSIGRIQVGLNLAPPMVIKAQPPLVALQRGVQRTWDISGMSLKMLGKMLVGEASIKNLTGPITIADYAGQTARAGVISFLSFMALISISLGVMNLLPIPVLDGGLLLYYALEVLTGRPIPERFGDMAQRAGIAVLIILMMVAVFNDLSRLFG